MMGSLEGICILLLALVLIGPQDLPKVLRAIGRMVRMTRSFSGEVMDMLENIPEGEPQGRRRNPPESD